MILPILCTFKGKLLLGVCAIFGTLLAAGEATSDRTLIITAFVSGVTTLMVALLGAIVSIFNSRKLSRVENLPREVQELKISLDGRLQELMESKEKAAYSAGGEQERIEERDRRGGAALVAQAAVPTNVIVKNEESDPANVKVTK